MKVVLKYDAILVLQKQIVLVVVCFFFIASYAPNQVLMSEDEVTFVS
jgi:hypothetical protein